MFDLIKELKEYQSFDAREEKNRLEVIKFLENNTNCYSRTNLAGHITAGGFVADDKGNILLNHHRKSGMWFQFGGHSDNDENSLNVAKREISEEAGIEDLELVSDKIFCVGVQTIPNSEKKKEPEHFHYDINFLFFVKNHNFKLSNESTEIKWVTIEEARNLVDQNDYDMHRMIDKYEQILKTKYCGKNI
ncbi:MAG: NUDIX hydrolase [Clostridia bacterium]|nr:NUDIX hydrolase [Clostridia bacterium]